MHSIDGPGVERLRVEEHAGDRGRPELLIAFLGQRLVGSASRVGPPDVWLVRRVGQATFVLVDSETAARELMAEWAAGLPYGEATP